MVRDGTTSDKKPSRLSRRRYLQIAGTATASIAVFGIMSTSTVDYRTITVPAEEIRDFTLQDGDSLENTIIDITADGAGYTIDANGDGWTIRNVGVRGYYDANVDDPIVVQCPNGGSGVIENVYLGDGGYNAPNGPTTGIFVMSFHSGDIRINRLNVRDWAGNGVYASGPGNHDDHPNPGGGGTVRITNSYVVNCKDNFRLGTDGSYCKNCVSLDGNRDYWGYYQTTKLIDCDIGGSIVAGEDSWNTSATIKLQNTRIGGNMITATSNDQIIGSSVGQPRDRLPTGVPTTPEEAAIGIIVDTLGKT